MPSQFGTFDYGRRIQQGTQNARNVLQFQQGAEERQRQNALRQSVRSTAGEEDPNTAAANRLRQQGYGQAANKLVQQGQQTRQGELQLGLNEYKLLSQEAAKVSDQQSYDAFRESAIQNGLVDPRQVPEEYSSEVQENLNRLAGVQRDLELVEVQGPGGGTIYAPEQEAIGMRAPSEGMSEREKEIQNLIQRGIPENWARDVASGNVQIDQDNFGRTILTNRATQERMILGEGQQDQGQAGQAEEEQDIIQPRNQQEQNMFQAVDETGPWAALRSLSNNVIGPFTEGVPFEETAESKQQIRQFNYAVQQAFKQDDGRMSNYERQIIREFLPDPDRVFTDPDKERSKLKEMRTFLQRQRDQLEQSMGETVTQQERGQLANQRQTVDRVLNLMGEPEQQEQFTRESPAAPETQQDFDALPSGSVFRDPDDGQLYRKP